ncbi:MAG: heparinase II/III family protein, partial [Candidatus Kapaibacteriota bacterium]
ITNPGYRHINFWNEPKTGFEWEPRYFKEIEIHLGNDIKHPWELGRMQHLPFLALSYSYNLNKDAEFAKQIAEEFQNQVLDFISTNPPGYSVQWRSPMDVSIRLVNWLVAYDLFMFVGWNFDESVYGIFFDCIIQHIYFILNNLEWSEGLRGNHYFANVASLIFAGAYLPTSEFSVQILAFALNELYKETLHQFLQDGGNFEASTYYHIQVAEMLFLSLYILNFLTEDKLTSLKNYVCNSKGLELGGKKTRKFNFSIDENISKIVFPSDFYERIFKIIKFTNLIKKSSDEYEQIGDNDSGIFLRLNYFFENFFFKNEIYENLLKRYLLDDLISTLSAGGSGLRYNFFKDKNVHQLYLPAKEITIFPKLHSCPHFGLYIINSLNYELYVRCGNIGQMGKGGHSHNDQLSITLNAKSRDFLVDPGLFCYTCNEDERNKYRSVHFHNTLALKSAEQNLWKTGDVENLFWIYKHRTKSKVVFQSEDRLILEHYAYGKPHRRTIIYHIDKLEIIDYLDLGAEKFIYFHLHPAVIVERNSDSLILVNNEATVELSTDCKDYEIQNYYYSPQYGLKIPSKRLVFTTAEKSIRFSINI